MSRHPNSRSSQTLTGDTDLKKAMGSGAGGPAKGKPVATKAPVGAKAGAKAPVAKGRSGKTGC